MDIADIVMDVFHNSDLRVFFHEHKINSLKWQMLCNNISYKTASS